MIIEQVRRDTGATRTLIVRTARHVYQLRSHRELCVMDLARERSLVIADIGGELVAHALAKCDELVRARRRLPKLINSRSARTNTRPP